MCERAIIFPHSKPATHSSDVKYVTSSHPTLYKHT
jgi:hypothetical protein